MFFKSLGIFELHLKKQIRLDKSCVTEWSLNRKDRYFKFLVSQYLKIIRF